MTETEQTPEETPAEKAPEKPSARASKTAAEKRAESLRERLLREDREQITVAFDAYGELRKTVEEAYQAVNKALARVGAVEKSCGTYLGRRVSLARRLHLKPVSAVLKVAHFSLRKAVVQMESAARTRDDVIEEASDTDVAR